MLDTDADQPAPPQRRPSEGTEASPASRRFATSPIVSTSTAGGRGQRSAVRALGSGPVLLGDEVPEEDPGHRPVTPARALRVEVVDLPLWPSLPGPLGHPTFPGLLAAVLVGFVGLACRGDRRDPKLAAAVVDDRHSRTLFE